MTQTILFLWKIFFNPPEFYMGWLLPSKYRLVQFCWIFQDDLSYLASSADKKRGFLFRAPKDFSPINILMHPWHFLSQTISNASRFYSDRRLKSRPSSSISSKDIFIPYVLIKLSVVFHLLKLLLDKQRAQIQTFLICPLCCTQNIYILEWNNTMC